MPVLIMPLSAGKHNASIIGEISSYNFKGVDLLVVSNKQESQETDTIDCITF